MRWQRGRAACVPGSVALSQVASKRALEFGVSHRIEEIPVDTHVPPDLAGGDRNGQPADNSLLQELHFKLAELRDPAPGELAIEVFDSSDGLCLVALGGEMDMSNAADLPRRVDGHLNGIPCWMIVELSRLEFLDSCGIRELIRVARAVKETGGAFALAAPTPIVGRVLGITNLSEYMAVEGSLGAALAHVRPSMA